jgi:2-iminoacetate synthase ThiH
MTPEQSRMARAALNWGLRDVPGVSHDTVARFERGEELKDSTVEKLQAAYEAAGLEFLPSNGVGEGVRWAKPPKKRKTPAAKKKP